MGKLKKVLEKIFFVVEDIVPTVMFIGLFLAFVIQIFSRYVLNKPLFWADELVMITYMWLVFMGAACVMRKKGHINFTIVYDKVRPLVKRIFNIIGDTIILITLILVLPDCFDFLSFLKFDKTVVLRLPVAVYYLPMAISTVLICLHLVYDLFFEFLGMKKEISHV